MWRGRSGLDKKNSRINSLVFLLEFIHGGTRGKIWSKFGQDSNRITKKSNTNFHCKQN